MTASSSSGVTAQKNGSFCLVLLVALKYMPTCGHSPQPCVGPRPGKNGRGRSTVFSSGKEEVWGRIYDKYVCIWKQAVFQVNSPKLPKPRVVLVKAAEKESTRHTAECLVLALRSGSRGAVWKRRAQVRSPSGTGPPVPSPSAVPGDTSQTEPPFSFSGGELLLLTL